ncbi:MAG: hypothetical protein J5736_05485 [Bacilli bacterium]|nr:hypothetical protein [Bacilli bacterium]
MCHAPRTTTPAVYYTPSGIACTNRFAPKLRGKVIHAKFRAYIGTYHPWLEDGVSAHLKKNNEESAAQIKEFIEHGEDPKILEAGYEVAKERDLPLIGQQLKKTYEELLEEKAKEKEGTH